MNTTIKINNLLQEFIKTNGYMPPKVYVDDRIYRNLCREHKIDDQTPITSILGMKVVVRFGGLNSIDFI